jgi:hypothetical protein
MNPIASICISVAPTCSMNLWAISLICGGLVVALSQIVIFGSVLRAINRLVGFQIYHEKAWVDIGNWAVGTAESSGIDDQSPTVNHGRQKDSLSLGVHFDVSNRSTRPVSIDSVVVTTGLHKDAAWHWKTFEDRTPFVLRPEVTGCDNSQAFAITFDLNGNEIVRYVHDGFFVRIHVQLFYPTPDKGRLCQDFSVEAVLKAGVHPTFTKQRARRMAESRRHPAKTDQ